MSFPTAPKPLRVPELDGIRGVACLLVVVWHYVYCRLAFAPVPSDAGWLSALQMTYAGVDLFFVLSGFLLGGILIDHRTAPNLLKVFYVRRACRLLPLYVVWLGLFLILRPALAPRPGGEWLFGHPLPFWSYATYTQNVVMAYTGSFGPHWLGITWSLAVEEQFYLVLPVAVLLLPPRALPFLSLLLVLAAPAFRYAAAEAGWGPLAGYVLLPGRWDGLFLGVLGAWFVRRPGWGTDPARTRRRLYAALALPAVGCGWLSVRSPGMFSPAMQTWGFTVVNLCFLLLILLAVSGARWAVVLRWGWLRRVGVVSYGVYTFHQGVAGLLFLALQGSHPMAGTPGAGLSIAAFGLTLILALLSYEYFELPVLRFGHRLRYREPAPEDSGAAAPEERRVGAGA